MVKPGYEKEESEQSQLTVFRVSSLVACSLRLAAKQPKNIEKCDRRFIHIQKHEASPGKGETQFKAGGRKSEDGRWKTEAGRRRFNPFGRSSAEDARRASGPCTGTRGSCHADLSRQLSGLCETL